MKTPPFNDLKKIVETYQERVRNTCFRFVKNPQDADDLAQDVFIKIYESLTTFRNESELSTWIYRIAVNKSLDHIRRANRKKRFARVTSIFSSGNSGEEVELRSTSDPQSDLEQKDRQRILDWALSALPENQKIAITLSKYEGFSNREIAEIMDITISAVESLIHRAKKNLHEKLADFYDKII